MRETMTLLDAAAALVMLDAAGAVARVHIESAATMDAPTVEPTGDPVTTVTVDTVAAGYRPRVAWHASTDPRATRTCPMPRTAASVTRDPFRR